jgi:hypothetical protein
VRSAPHPDRRRWPVDLRYEGPRRNVRAGLEVAHLARYGPLCGPRRLSSRKPLSGLLRVSRGIPTKQGWLARRPLDGGWAIDH